MQNTVTDGKDTQFRLSEDGVISFQVQESNPLPGVPVAKLVKGADALTPGITVTHQSGAALVARLEAWWAAHVKGVLEPLVALAAESDFKPKPHVKSIMERVHAAMGIVPREELEDFIKDLDADDRRDLRAAKIRLGPVLVFIPALNKPASVRLRAMLWSLARGDALPAQVPNDGIVSMAVDPAAADRDFYQAIGYPVYASRAIRIDMLDRVICEVYDSADKGKFQAQHKMAEWLGCGIEDLYAVLSAMGHVRIEDAAKPEEALKEGEKPELAMFFLKKGKANASGKPAARTVKAHSKAKPEKNSKNKGGKRSKTGDRQPKVMRAEAKVNPEDSPFAILEQLKAGK